MITIDDAVSQISSGEISERSANYVVIDVTIRSGRAVVKLKVGADDPGSVSLVPREILVKTSRDLKAVKELNPRQRYELGQLLDQITKGRFALAMLSNGNLTTATTTDISSPR